MDLIFHPSAAEMYPADFSTYVEETAISASLCGASRPGHFRGVCTIVLKLFTVIAPDIGVFGQKDYQQGMVIRRMVRDLNLPVRIVSVATARDPDGLALSSRNAFLTAAERAQAPALRKALLAAQHAFKAGEKNAGKLRQIVAKAIRTAPLARVDYIEAVDAESFTGVKPSSHSMLIAVAVFFGGTRLIDNILL